MDYLLNIIRIFLDLIYRCDNLNDSAVICGGVIKQDQSVLLLAKCYFMLW